MDYQEWLFNEYVLSVSPLTSSVEWQDTVSILVGGLAIVTFGSVIQSWLNSFGFDLLIPVMKVNYTTFMTDTFEPTYFNPLIAQLDGYGLSVVSSVLYQVLFYTNYFVVDLVFAYLTGDLSNDTSYA